MLGYRNLKLRYLILLPIFLLISQYQNCGVGVPVNFRVDRISLRSEGGTGDGFDGKPSPGTYCRIYDQMSCKPAVDNLQSLVSVDDTKIVLKQDNCIISSTNFNFSDVVLNYTSLMPDYIGLSRGIFKKCEVDGRSLPVRPEIMAETFCTSRQDKTALVIEKSLSTQNLELTLIVSTSSGKRFVKVGAILKTQNSDGISYNSNTEKFDLKVMNSIAQTHSGHLVTVIDEEPMDINLECRIAKPAPTIVNEQDLEISPSWIDTNRLAGYWKLNEFNAGENTRIADATVFNSFGTFFTGNELLNKSVLTVRGNAISFDGSNDHILTSDPADAHLDFDTRSFSFMAWIFKTGNSSGFDIPLWKGGQSNNVGGYDIECGSGVCNANISDGRALAQSIVVAPFGPDGNAFIGRWVHLTAVVDRNSQQLRAYVDGSLVATANISAVGSVSNNLNFQIGGTQTGPYKFMGSIDDVAVWNGALTASEIQEIFQRLRPKFY